MMNLFLSGMIIPIFATWLLPEAIKKEGISSNRVILMLAFLFMLVTIYHIESKSWFALIIALLSCLVSYVGALAFIFFTSKNFGPKG